MTRTHKKLALIGALLGLSAPATAGVTIGDADGKSLTIAAGLRSSVAWGDSIAGADFTLESAQIIVSGQISPILKGTISIERDGAGEISLQDGFVQFEPMESFNVWIGRLLPPSDRANLDGPYFVSVWAYPGVVSLYPQRFAGRDDGVTVWGKLFEQRLVYSAGAFRGHNRIAGASNEGGSALFAGRIAYNFLAPEPSPAYLTASTYYGEVDLLTVAVSGQVQKNAIGTAALRGDYRAWNADVLFEKKLGDAGAVTLEYAYYDYGTGGAADVALGFGGAGAADNVGGIEPGTAHLVAAAYLFPQKIGVGFVQPSARYQTFKYDLTNERAKRLDAGVNYVIDGHNARLALNYVRRTNAGVHDHGAVFGVQFQY
jgi:hypothetical protein